MQKIFSFKYCKTQCFYWHVYVPVVLKTIRVASLFREKIWNCLCTKLLLVLSAESLYVPQFWISQMYPLVAFKRSVTRNITSVVAKADVREYRASSRTENEVVGFLWCWNASASFCDVPLRVGGVCCCWAFFNDLWMLRTVGYVGLLVAVLL